MSMPQLTTQEKVTVEEYLRAEREAQQRHEYLDGEIIAMAGESPIHADISVNVVISLGNQLKGNPCRLRTKDTKVRSGPDRPHGSHTRGLFSYPDAVIICGEPIYHDKHRDVVLNPTAIIEVLSPSTEAFDRGEKFVRLRHWNPSLMDYVVISQDSPLIEVFHRTGETTWSLTPYEELEAVADLTAIDCQLPLADVYDRVEFPSDEDDESESTDES